MATEKKLIKSEIGLVVSTFNTEENKNSILKKNELQLKMKNETYDVSNITQANNIVLPSLWFFWAIKTIDYK